MFLFVAKGFDWILASGADGWKRARDKGDNHDDSDDDDDIKDGKFDDMEIREIGEKLTFAME